MVTEELLGDEASHLEDSPAEEIVAWATTRFGERLALACSFQDCVIVDLAVRADPHVDVVFLDTGFHFEETLTYVEEVRARYDLNLRVARPGPEAEPWTCGSGECCTWRKVRPLDEALRGRDAWMTGLKRCDSPTRAGAPVVSWDEARRMVKVNPLAAWTDDDVDAYVAEHDLPVHPLMAQGFLSIGCAPTTAPVAPGEDRRAGRWRGSGKLECGLHV